MIDVGRTAASGAAYGGSNPGCQCQGKRRTTSRSHLGSVASDLHHFTPTGPPMSTAGWCWHRICDSKSLTDGCAVFI